MTRIVTITSVEENNFIVKKKTLVKSLSTLKCMQENEFVGSV